MVREVSKYQHPESREQELLNLAIDAAIDGDAIEAAKLVYNAFMGKDMRAIGLMLAKLKFPDCNVEPGIDQDDCEHQFHQGLCHLIGIGTEVNYDKAIHLFTLSADQDYADAHLLLGLLFDEQFLGVKGKSDENQAKALHHYQQAADQKHPAALLAVARIYDEQELGNETVSERTHTVISLYKRASEQGETAADLGLATIYLSALQIQAEEPVSEVDADNYEHILPSGETVTESIGVRKTLSMAEKREIALKYIQKAIDGGSSPALIALIGLYEDGYLTDSLLEQNTSIVSLGEQALKLGNPQGAFILGEFYASQARLPVDINNHQIKSLAYFVKAIMLSRLMGDEESVRSIIQRIDELNFDKQLVAHAERLVRSEQLTLSTNEIEAALIARPQQSIVSSVITTIYTSICAKERSSQTDALRQEEIERFERDRILQTLLLAPESQYQQFIRNCTYVLNSLVDKYGTPERPTLAEYASTAEWEVRKEAHNMIPMLAQVQRLSIRASLYGRTGIQYTIKRILDSKPVGLKPDSPLAELWGQVEDCIDSADRLELRPEDMTAQTNYAAPAERMSMRVH